MDEDGEEPARQARRGALQQALIIGAGDALEVGEGFDAMEIARAFLAVAFAHLEFEGPERAGGYYRHLKKACQGSAAELGEFVRVCASEYEKDKAAQRRKEAAWRN